jgi:hypothetical protein
LKETEKLYKSKLKEIRITKKDFEDRKHIYFEDYGEELNEILRIIIKKRPEYASEKNLIEFFAIQYLEAVLYTKDANIEPPDIEAYISLYIPSASQLTFDAIETLAQINGAVTTQKLKNFVLPNHKLMHELVKKGEAGSGDVGVEFSVENVMPAFPDIKTTATLIYDENVELPKNYTLYDRAVFNAICSLYEAGIKSFTPAMVFRAMTGRENTEAIRESNSNLKRIQASIERQRTALVKINCKDEFEKRKLPFKAFDENILMASGFGDIVVNGMLTKGYVLKYEPILYSYCKATTQVITVPIHLLNTKTVKNKPDVIVIKEYLIRQIELLKKGKRHNKKMLYETIFTECGISFESKDRTEQKRDRDCIKKILEEWKEKQYIKAYREYTQGRKVMGVEIEF